MDRLPNHALAQPATGSVASPLARRAGLPPRVLKPIFGSLWGRWFVLHACSDRVQFVFVPRGTSVTEALHHG